MEKNPAGRISIPANLAILPTKSGKDSRGPDHEGFVGGALSRHLCFRALLLPQRNCDSQILSAPFKTGTEETLSRAFGSTREELEVLRRRRARTRILGRLHGCLRRHDS